MRNIILFVLITAVTLLSATPAAAGTLEVYKSPTCGCCKKWISHLEENGLDVTPRDVPDLVPYKIRAGLTPALASCHTAFVDGYVIEGHVPAREISRLLAERPDARGLAVPGMPVGSPGMEQGDAREPYEVLLIHRDGSTSVYARY
jgi:hypothetical protein